MLRFLLSLAFILSITYPTLAQSGRQSYRQWKTDAASR